MTRRLLPAVGLFLGLAVLCLPDSALALIPAAFPLKTALKDQDYIVVAKVEKLYPDKPAMMLAVHEVLKGKPAFKKLPVNLTADTDGQKTKDTERLLKRVADDLPLIVFVKEPIEANKPWIGFGYTNGSWFQMTGHQDPETKAVRWSFQHFEPVLRGTFKGTTAEMRQTILDAAAGKKDPPKVNPKETPGIGPELKPEGDKKEEKKSSRGVHGGPTFAVIPTVAIGGPLAILSMLFPSLFGKPKEVLQRYMALLTVISINSVLYLLHAWFAEEVTGYWWGQRTTLWLTMAGVTLIGTFWAWRRQQAVVQRVQDGKAELPLPPRGEEIAFQVLSVASVGMVGYALGVGRLLTSPWLEFFVTAVAIWAGTLGVFYLRYATQRWPARPSRLPLEGAMLAALTCAFAAIGATFLPAPTAEKTVAEASDQYKLLWQFQPPKISGRLDSTALVTEDRVYTAAACKAGFKAWGTVYCLERSSGKQLWSFDNDGDMKQVFCSPCVADGKLYIGEGYHQDNNCKMFCLDAASGKKLWEFPTKSHTESTPVVANGKVYFGAGDDGVYCLDAQTGTALWNLPGMHVDTNPTVVGDRLYGGSGYGDRYWYFCVDASSGSPLWRAEWKLPVFGSATVVGDQVFFGTGNGNLLESDAKPAGALLCVDAQMGKPLWPAFEVPDGVHTKPAVDLRHVYFGSRDGHLYCLNRNDGKLLWKRKLGGKSDSDLGSPVVAAPFLATCTCCGASSTLYAASSDGKLYCLDPDNGQDVWTFDVPGNAKQIVSSPRMFLGQQAGRRQLFFGVCLGPEDETVPVLYCLEDRHSWPVLRGHP